MLKNNVYQAGIDEVMERSLRDFRELGWLADGVGVQVVYSSVPLMAGKRGPGKPI